ncbi:MFS transporter [Caulobacter sp. RHG1]|uniref:MFS transporter n=1 Tax=Caulobacter sp. (strain RHG1) TaxID=2545762 RepID=UPI0019D5EACA|nr:MFS transporter [Caulobacter sp. RHG1]NQE61808.1 putative MFS-type transporter [Caulobacter sp. RHG1]
MTIAFLAMAVASLVWGGLSDRIGPRAVVLTGAVILAASLALASRAATLLQFQLIFGLAVGGATAAVFAPIMATVTGWFETQRSLAVSLVSAGMGVAPMTMSPLAGWLISHQSWRPSLLILAGVVAMLMIPAALLMRRPPALTSPAPGGEAEPPPISLGEALRSRPFVVLVTANFFCCATHSGPIFHTVSYAVTCGIPLMAAVSIYSLEGLAGMGGRIAFGVAGDRFGAKRVLVAGLLFQAVAALGYLQARSLGDFYAAAALFGFIYGGVMPLYAVLAREAFPLSMMGTVIGGTAMAGGLGMSTGPLTGGLIYDRFGSYAGLFLGSFVLGLIAVVIALTFRPRRAPEPVPYVA